MKWFFSVNYERIRYYPFFQFDCNSRLKINCLEEFFDYSLKDDDSSYQMFPILIKNLEIWSKEIPIIFIGNSLFRDNLLKIPLSIIVNN